MIYYCQKWLRNGLIPCTEVFIFYIFAAMNFLISLSVEGYGSDLRLSVCGVKQNENS